MIFTSTAASGQIKLYPEQVALFHLDSLVKVNELYLNAKYRADGKLTKYQTDSMDVFWINYAKNKNQLKCKFTNIQIIEEPNLKQFDTQRRPKNRKVNLLGINHYIKIKDIYYVSFSLATSKYEGYSIIIAINDKGDMINSFISSYIL
jgi:hypothetical protein